MQPSEPDALNTPAPAEPRSIPAAHRRPFGLYVIIVLLILQALLGVFVAAFLGLGLAVGVEDLSTLVAADIWSIVETLGIMLVGTVVIVGLWRYRLWAWYGVLLLLAYWMATDTLAYFRGAPEYFSMVLNVALVLYLNQLEVKELFETPPQRNGANV